MSVDAALDTNVLLYAASKAPADRAIAVVAGARQLGAPILYSEDLGEGQDYAGVTVVNPFRNLAE